MSIAKTIEGLEKEIGSLEEEVDFLEHAPDSDEKFDHIELLANQQKVLQEAMRILNAITPSPSIPHYMRRVK